MKAEATEQRPKVMLDAMPEHQADAMMRTLIGCVSRLFENPDIKADYERWKRERKEAKG